MQLLSLLGLFVSLGSAVGLPLGRVVATNNTQAAPLIHDVESELATLTRIREISLGPRPYYVVDDMGDSLLKTKLLRCKNKRMKSNKWTIGHRGGGTLQFPEHTLESALAGARMGAGILECDVTFTKDRELVCRHSQCDLHTTTNVVVVPELNAKCTQPFAAANGTIAASAKCCTSDLTLAEFKSLCGKMDSYNANATTPETYLGGTYPWRTNLYSQCGTLLSHSEHIRVVDKLGLDFSPELKIPQVAMPFDGNYTQDLFAQQFVDHYKIAGIDFKRI